MNKIAAEHIAKSDTGRPASQGQTSKQLNGIDSLMRISATSPLPNESAGANAQSPDPNAVAETKEQEEAEEDKEGENAAEESKHDVKQMEPDDFIL